MHVDVPEPWVSESYMYTVMPEPSTTIVPREESAVMSAAPSAAGAAVAVESDAGVWEGVKVA